MRGSYEIGNPGFAGRLAQAALFHASVLGLWAMFNCFRLFDMRFRKSVESFAAQYQFRMSSCARTLVFRGGRIRTRRGTVQNPDYVIRILDPPGLLRSVRDSRVDPISLVMENKISQSGNLFFLYRFGYLLGLCEARLDSGLECIKACGKVPGVGM